eukprot:CAMPEP_0113524652 /NCGR_PEP_ID=MMETSP0014_2-20120614/46328_1 /TAXON_ID=2857 /ORGANISM="Nitzschia sp." /LENGTH=1379 /DNA_ID=CAMNT_0000422773 /DNA_START=158 /DNA_END=4297 /DNA_ORIENTATION=- /assembly_acc=CAM_ASM_000159
MRDRIRQRPCPLPQQPCPRSSRRNTAAAAARMLLPPLLLLTTTLLLLDVAPVVAVQPTTFNAAATEATAAVASTDTISSAIIDRLLEEDENDDDGDGEEEDDEQDILDDLIGRRRRRRQQSPEDFGSDDKLGSGSDDDTDIINQEEEEEERSSPEKNPQQPPDNENDEGDEAEQDLGDDRAKQKLDSQLPPSVLPTTGPPDDGDIQDDLRSDQQPSSVPSTEVDESTSSRKDDDISKAGQEDEDQKQDRGQQKQQRRQAIDDIDHHVDGSEDDGSGDRKVKPSSSSRDDDQKDATTTDTESKRDNNAEDISTDTSSSDDIAEDHDTTTALGEEAQQQHHTQQKDDNAAADNSKEGKQQYAYDEYPVDDTAVELDLEDDASTATKRVTAKDKTKTKQDDDDKSSDPSSDRDDDDDDKTVVPDENDGDESELTSKEDGASTDDNDTAKQDDNESDEPPESPESKEDIIPEDATKEDIVKDEEESNENVTADIGDDEENSADDSNAEVGDEDDEPISSQFSVDYASKSAGALIIDKSHDFKGTSNLLNGDKDKYAITPCEEKKKFVVLSLSEDILVKEIKLANYERFASTMKNIQVMGSQTLGTRTWFDLGNYTARPGLGEQDFAVEKPAWARYLKFKFRTHHGMEYYCTLSQIQVHGSTMVQGFHEQWELIEEENEEGESTRERVDATKAQNELKDATGDLSMNETKTEGVDISQGEKEPTPNHTAELFPEASADASQVQADTHHGKRPTQEDIEAIAVLDAFASSSALFEVLQGRCVNEDLYPDMYTHLPTTLESLPRSMVRSASEKSTAMNGRNDSQYYTIRTKQLQSFTTPEVGDKDSSMIALGNTESISSPKMSEFSSNLGEKVSPTSTFRFNFTWDIRARLTHLWNSTVGDKSNGDSQGQIPDPTQENGDKKIDIQSSAQPEPKHDDISDSEIVIETSDDSSAMDQAFIRLLQDLPSAECLGNLDFSAFKAKFSSTRKKSVFSGGPGNSVMEPIFKKLTDEIFALQTSVSVHDQFTRATIACYQRVLLDLMVEMTKMNNDSSDRITRLEEQMLEWRLQRALNFIIDLVLRTGNWTISKLYLAAIFAAEQYPSIEKAVGQAFSRFVEWSTRVGIPRCRQAVSTVVRFTTMLFDRFLTFAFGPEGLDILATPQQNEVPSPFFGSKDSMIEEFLNGRQSFDSSSVTAEDMTWIFPVVPILLLLLTLRILMCFAPSYTATKMVYWPSPARIANSRSPRKDPRSATPRSGRSSRSHNTSTPNSGSEIQRSNSPKKLPGTRGPEIRNSSHENIPALMDEKFAAVDVKAESILSGRIQSPSSSDVIEGNGQPQQNRTPGVDQKSRRTNGHMNVGGGGGGGGHDEPSIVVSPSVVSVDSQPKTN